MSVYKVGSAVGGIGTIAGVGASVVLANRETEPTTEQALKTLSKEGEQIKAEKIKEIEITAKTREDIETMTKENLKELAEIEGFKEVDGKNNLCELIQREFVRKIIKKEFKFVATTKDNDFAGFFSVCISSKTITEEKQ